MSAAIPTQEPTQVTAGDTVKWNKQDLSDYLVSDGWALSYVLINSAAKIEISASSDGEGFAVVVAAATTASWNAGTYSWQAYATNSGTSERVCVGKGHIEILPDFASADTLDNRTHTKKVLDAIEAVIENRASTDQESYKILGRELRRTPLKDLIDLKDKYTAKYIAEQNAEAVKAGRGGKNKIKVRF